MSLSYAGAEIKTLHSLESWNGGVIVMISGSVLINGCKPFSWHLRRQATLFSMIFFTSSKMMLFTPSQWHILGNTLLIPKLIFQPLFWDQVYTQDTDERAVLKKSFVFTLHISGIKLLRDKCRGSRIS